MMDKKTLLFFCGPRRMSERIYFKFGENSLVRHLDSPEDLNKMANLKDKEFYLIVKAEH
jgi:hypothetical protein